MRTCRICGEAKALAEFYRDERGPGGFRTNCKVCHRAAQARRQLENRDAYMAYQAAYRETHREQARAKTAAYRLAKPDRVRQAQVAYRANPAHQQVARERAKAFRIANPKLRAEYEKRRRANKLSTSIGFITPEMLDAKLAYWGRQCWMCGDDPDTWDHVKPLSRKGPHVLANLRPACRPCNTRKSDTWPLSLVKVG